MCLQCHGVSLVGGRQPGGGCTILHISCRPFRFLLDEAPLHPITPADNLERPSRASAPSESRHKCTQTGISGRSLHSQFSTTRGLSCQSYLLEADRIVASSRYDHIAEATGFRRGPPGGHQRGHRDLWPWPKSNKPDENPLDYYWGGARGKVRSMLK